MASADQTLPAKEGNVFKTIVKCYEQKQYKKALKAAETILKKFPEHGETLAMKGLTLNGLDKKTEAYELVRRGLKANLRSHVCWHVYGLLYRSDREYAEAVKCYRNAMRLDKDNYQIMRDLALLQGQIRELDGFVETRQQMLAIKSNNKNNWIGFAIAHHLNKSYDMAINVIKAYEDTLEENAEQDRYEHSEMLLYKAMIMEEGGKLDEAVEYLDSIKPLVADKLGMREQRARILLQGGKKDLALKEYRWLVDYNPEHYRYLEGMAAALGYDGAPTPAKVEGLKKEYAALQEKFPKCSAAKRIPLDFLSGKDFEEAMAKYIQVPLRRGIPSLFCDLKPLYADAAKAEAIGKVVEAAVASLKKGLTFPGLSEKEEGEVLAWALALLGQHHDKVGRTGEAFKFLDEATDAHPEIIDIYLFKAKVAKHGGDPEAAAAFADKARQMDLADRYLNSVCTKRMLRAEQVDKAEATVTLFTKDGDNMNNLYDMQCMWYEIEYGDSQLRQKCYGKALKKYLAVGKHFDDIEEDQFDFHSYCLRKMTLRAYVRMLRMEDGLYSHKFYTVATAGAVRCYLALHDTPPGEAAAAAEEAAMEGMSKEDRKKYRAKLRKAEARAKREAEEKAKAAEEAEKAAAKEAAKEAAKDGDKKSNKKGGGAAKEKDMDPDGEKLAAVEAPLDKAQELVNKLQQSAPDSLATHTVAVEYYLRRRRALPALRAAKRALAIAPGAPEAHRAAVQALHLAEAGELAGVARKVADEERGALLGGKAKTLSEYNAQWAKAGGGGGGGGAEGSLARARVAAEMGALLAPGDKAKHAASLVGMAGAMGAAGHAEAVKAHAALISLGDAAGAATWKEAGKKAFPFSAFFEGAQRPKVE